MQFSSVNCAQITRHQLQSTAVCCENLVYDVFRALPSLGSSPTSHSRSFFSLPFTYTSSLSLVRMSCIPISVPASEHNATASLLKLTNVIKLLSTCNLNCCALFLTRFSVVSFMFRHSFYFNFCFVFLFAVLCLLLCSFHA